MLRCNGSNKKSQAEKKVSLCVARCALIGADGNLTATHPDFKILTFKPHPSSPSSLTILLTDTQLLESSLPDTS
ncbi:hypothetical protein TWF694_002667 [Orbilia ellipsospora]|uniref:Uncharacterized protein n=1 Tax=Orbilia ellipsospora TaxID=2528407 RepID=A0AAV9X3Y9_9PEZI